MDSGYHMTSMRVHSATWQHFRGLCVLHRLSTSDVIKELMQAAIARMEAGDLPPFNHTSMQEKEHENVR